MIIKLNRGLELVTTLTISMFEKGKCKSKAKVNVEVKLMILKGWRIAHW